MVKQIAFTKQTKRKTKDPEYKTINMAAIKGKIKTLSEPTIDTGAVKQLRIKETKESREAKKRYMPSNTPRIQEKKTAKNRNMFEFRTRSNALVINIKPALSSEEKKSVQIHVHICNQRIIRIVHHFA